LVRLLSVDRATVVSSVEFGVLGPLEVAEAGSQLRLGGPKQRAVLATLLLHANKVVSADSLVEAVWGETPPANARQTLQVYVANLRRLLNRGSVDGTERLAIRHGGYSVLVRPGELDLDAFRQKAEAGRAGRGTDPRNAADLFASALAVWRGPAFPDLGVTGLTPPEVVALEEQRLGVLEDRVDADLDAGRGTELVAELDALVATCPLRERLHGQRMVALYRAGRQADALQAYQAARQSLLDQLGVEPGPELARVEQAVLLQEPWLESSVPAVRTRSVLPASAHSLVGRQEELCALEGLLGAGVGVGKGVGVDVGVRDGRARVVSLLGPGGTGKSRLALEVARRVQSSFPDGVFFVPLSAVTDPRLVVPTIANVLRVKETSDRPLGSVVTDRLSDQVTLLVLDNFEQLLPAAGAIAELTEGAPALKVLVTSRAALNISAEYQYHLAPLPLPPLPPEDGHLGPERLRGNTAVELYVDRARAVVEGFELTEDNAEAVVRICHRIDGLPLAVELAAARVRVLAPDALLRRLDAHLQVLRGGPADVPTRQRTLRDTIAWSYDLLDPPERVLFATCAVFAGGCTLGALEAVSADPTDGAAARDASGDVGGDGGEDVLDSVDSLVGQSLLRRHETCGGLRFFMLQTIRDFAGELLDASPAAALTRRRHAEYYLRLAGEGAAGLAGARQEDWLVRLTAERDNFRAALTWSAGEHGDPGTALGLAGALTRFWEMTGGLEEGEQWLESALQMGAGQPPELLQPVFTGAGTVAWAKGDHVRATELHQRALGLARETGNRAAEAFALNNLGVQALDRLDFPAAKALYEEAQAIAASIDEPLIGAMVKHNLGESLTRQADLAGAAAMYREALDVFRAHGNTWYVAGTLRGLAGTALRQGDHGYARDALRESVELATQLGANLWIAEDLEALSALAQADGDPARAVVLLGTAEQVRRRIGIPVEELEREEWEHLAGSLRDQLGDDAFTGSWAEGQQLSVPEAMGLAALA
jgi:predicted ATPase/DNA-binding SARP family transcriptional activator